MQVKKAQRHQYPNVTLGIDTSAHLGHLPELKHSDIYAYTETQSDLGSRTMFYKSYTCTSLKQHNVGRLVPGPPFRKVVKLSF